MVVATIGEFLGGDQAGNGLRLTRDERLEVRRRIASGESFVSAADAVRCTTKTVQRLLNAVGGAHAREPDRSKLRRSLVEREEISLGIESGDPQLRERGHHGSVRSSFGDAS
jgi:hypothetical protein